MSSINENVSAKKTMDKELGSLQNRMRAIYNYGFKAGYDAGMEYAKTEMVEYLKANHDDLLIFGGVKKEEM